MGTSTLAVDVPTGSLVQSRNFGAFDRTSPVAPLLDRMEKNLAFDAVGAVVHRVADGMPCL